MSNLTNNFVFGKNPSLTNSRFLINNTNKEDSIIFDSSETKKHIFFNEKSVIKSNNISIIQTGEHSNIKRVSLGYTSANYQYNNSMSSLIMVGGIDTSSKYDGLSYSYDGANFYGVLA